MNFLYSWRSKQSMDLPECLPPAEREFARSRRTHWEAVAARPSAHGRMAGGYHARLAAIYRHVVPQGAEVLEIGCGKGDLLAAVSPAGGVGVDFAPAMVAAAARRHPGHTFVLADAHELDLGRTFDVVILSDLLNDLWNVQTVLDRVRRHCGPHTRVVINGYSRLWQPILAAAQRTGLATTLLPQNWLTPADMGNLLALSGFEAIKHWSEILLPLRVPVLAGLANRYLVKLPLFRSLALTNVFVARPRPDPAAVVPQPLVSVVVPARNEAGTIAEIVRRVPQMGAGTELIFVEGGSGDDTWERIREAVAQAPAGTCAALRQPGQGKGDAVRAGFAAARGEILMILDADLTVPPEDLPQFYAALHGGFGELVNGVRLVYPMEERAMRFLNLLGNKFFSLAFSWLLGQPVKDTLCGTKAIRRRSYELIAANRSSFGEFDPFGDFDLLFGAAKLNLRIVDLPIRYHERTYGTTNISRWRHGVLLLRMLAFAAARLKFV